MTETVERGRWFPKMPPALPGESDYGYTDRLTGADGADRVPYDHDRNRQCSIGYHAECSDPAGERCKCPCHTPEGRLEMRVDELEEAFIASWALATGTRTGKRAEGIAENLRADVEKLLEQRPELREWYLTQQPEGDQQ